jgi:hypothetical protein
MSKITFRADDELIDELEAFDASKSEVMRRALRSYLDGAEDTVDTSDVISEAESDVSATDTGVDEDSIDALLADRIDDLLEDRLAAREHAPRRDREVNVNITLEGAGEATVDDAATRAPPTDADAEADDEPARAEVSCHQCGDTVGPEHVYCPNCGAKASRRVFCDCGDEMRSDWAFCPSCGRRTPAADVLDNG